MVKKMQAPLNVVNLIEIARKKIFFLVLSALLGLVGSLIYANFVIKPEYTASGTFIINQPINPSSVNTAVELAKSTQVLTLAINLLHEEYPELGDFSLAASEIRSNLIVTAKDNSPTIVVLYSSNKSEHNEKIVNSITKASVLYGNENYIVFNSRLVIGEVSLSSYYTGISKFNIYMLGLIGGTSVGAFFVILYANFSKKILFTSQYEYLAPHNMFKIATKRPEISLKEEAVKLHIKLEHVASKKVIKSVGLIFLENQEYEDDIIFEYSRALSSLGYSSLIIDLSLVDSPSRDGFTMKHKKPSLFLSCENDLIIEPSFIDGVQYLFGGTNDIAQTRMLKSNSFKDLLVNYQSKYNILLLKMPHDTINYSFTPFFELIDTLVINIVINKTNKANIENILSNLNKQDCDVFLNFIC